MKRVGEFLGRLFGVSRFRTQAVTDPSAPVFLTEEDKAKLAAIMELVNAQEQPNIHPLISAVRNVEAVHLNLKFYGYDLARRLADALPAPVDTQARSVGLASKASVQADLETDWAAHWHRELGIARILHRKLWELAYVVQAIWEEGHLRPGARGLGFGCGTEPLPSYFAAQGVAVTATDLPPEEAQQSGWADSSQYALTLDQAFFAHLVDRGTFDRLVEPRNVNMNAIPDDLAGYDFCWSVCALEHLGSIELGMRFIENAMETLRPGGLAVHTTEYNIDPHGPTIDNWPSVMLQRRHLEAVADGLRAKGHWVAPLDFDLGDRPLDRFIDLPPWPHNMSPELRAWVGAEHHLKVATDGFISTCFGLKIRKAI